MSFIDTPEKHIDSVSKLLQIAENQMSTSDIQPAKWLYRGESNVDYDLKPGIGRLINRDPFNNNLDNLLKFEEQAFNHFKVKTYNQLRENNDYILLATAQHHGLKTRLLDWSLNLLTALYFAVENESKYNVDGAFIAFQLPKEYKFNDMPSDSYPLKVIKSDYYFIYTPDLSPRIRAQQGVFQLFTSPVRPFGDAYNLLKFRIISSAKKRIKRQLFEMGIHAESLFPDMDGIAKTINYVSFNIG